MKKILVLAAVVSAFACSAVKAATLSVVQNAPTVYSVYLDGAPQNGNFDTIFFKATPDVGFTFINTNSGLAAGVPRPAGQAFTYPNRLINSDPLDFPGGPGWTLIGLINNASELSYTAGPLGGKISTANEPDGKLFLGTVDVSATNGTGTGSVQIISAGNLLATAQIAIGGIPEPASLGLASMALVGLAGFRRRKA
jgi:hypothetical protein